MATRNRLTFISQFKRFINNLFIVHLVSTSHVQCPNNFASSSNELHNSLQNKRGRRRLFYHEGSDKTKKRRIQELLENIQMKR